MKQKQGHLIKQVLPDSIAEEMGVEPGDRLLSVNQEVLEDVFDYRYLINDEELEILIEKADGEQWILDIEKEYDEDLGIEFENDLMSEYHSCHNKCMFCFIDQMPKGMRNTLYFKDDDSRLSFLQGNYITLTNMKEKDIDRIIRFHLAPINISVHTTNPELRVKMLHNRFAGQVLSWLQKLYEHQVEMNGQIVLCKGVNDGRELDRTIQDLSAYLPFMRSVSVVPAGITRYREGLYPLELYTKAEAEAVIDLIEGYQSDFYQQYGLHFIHASDEFYLLADRDFPEEERYDGYIQLENGVGMMRLLKEEFTESLNRQKQQPEYEREKQSVQHAVTIATGKLAGSMLRTLARLAMEAYPGLNVQVVEIQNDFFGETITVAGLITGQDLVRQVNEQKKNQHIEGTTLLITSHMLRMGEQVFLDDLTVEEAEAATGMKIQPVGSSGGELLLAMLGKAACPQQQEGFVYVKAYGNDK
ncbi:MAG: DUF512 domain-containing protein [Lachnospiraceae bacterium]|nr:DUF512 domain-containing protein [Lachnospiraceae bacterium]